MLLTIPSTRALQLPTSPTGGAGGKGTWGKLGSELQEEEEDTGALDANDPNYDEATQDPIKMKVFNVERTDVELQVR